MKLINAKFKAPSSIGKYFIEFTLVIEHKFWFEERGLQTVKFPINVDFQSRKNHKNNSFYSDVFNNGQKKPLDELIRMIYNEINFYKISMK
jgi:hypothetical protein